MILAGVIGWPVAHSRSPTLHRFWFAAHGVQGDYLRLPVRPAAVSTALRGLAALGFAGCNVTLPHKEAAAAAVDRLSPGAARLGAVNLVTITPDGTLDGDNTDGGGFLAHLRHTHPAWRLDRPAVILGAGGAARAIAGALIDAGVPALRVANRNPSRAEHLVAAIGGMVVPWDARDDALTGAGLLVNTTTQGMTGQPPLALDLASLPKDAIVADIVYAPLETPLLATARRQGRPTLDGLGMLLHQAVPAFEAFTGIRPAVTPDLADAVAATLAG